MLLLAELCSSSMYLRQTDEREFVEWMREMNLVFVKDEYNIRFGIWLSNKRLASERNHFSTFRYQMGPLAHLTPSEYAALVTSNRFLPPHSKKFEWSKRDPPARIDYREEGVIGSIKDSGSCASDWAFATVLLAESAYALKTSDLIPLSESNLIDCVDSCSGCNGGSIEDALDYVLKQQYGLFMRAADYPYAPSVGSCRFDPGKGVACIESCHQGDMLTEKQLQAAIAEIGPSAVHIDASSISFQLYGGGIYDEPSCDLQKAKFFVGLIGYGTDSDTHTPFWIIRNSWGTSWGEGGYMRLVSGKNNNCGINYGPWWIDQDVMV